MYVCFTNQIISAFRWLIAIRDRKLKYWQSELSAKLYDVIFHGMYFTEQKWTLKKCIRTGLLDLL